MKLKPLSPTSLRASPWSFGQKTSEIRIQTLAQAPPLQCTLRNWHEVFVHTNQLTSFKAKIGSKSSTRLHPKLQKTWCFSCSCTFVVFNIFMVAMTPAFWYSATLFSKKLVFPCREIISIQSKGFERWKILGWFSDINKRSATNSMYWAMSTWKWGTNTLKQTWKIKIQTTSVFLKNYLACHQGCHSKCHASVPFRTTRAYGDVWIRVVFHLGAEGLSSFPANCTVKLHLKVEKCWVKSQRCLLGMANHMASVNLPKLSKLFKSIPLMLKRSTTWVPIFSLVIFVTHLSPFLLWSLAEEQMNFRSASTAPLMIAWTTSSGSRCCSML